MTKKLPEEISFFFFFYSYQVVMLIDALPNGHSLVFSLLWARVFVNCDNGGPIPQPCPWLNTMVLQGSNQSSSRFNTWTSLRDMHSLYFTHSIYQLLCSGYMASRVQYFVTLILQIIST